MSIVVPVFDEEAAIPIFLDAVRAVLDRLGLRGEFVFVDDGSRDRTRTVLTLAAATSTDVRVVALTRNFGKEAALTAGLDHVRGDVVIPMDVDLQDPPELIGPFIEKWREGYDVVYGVRAERRSDGPMKRTSARAFYRVFNAVSPMHVPEDVGDFRLMDRRVVEAVKKLPERSRFMKGVFAWVGFKSCGVPYERPERSAGKSSFNYRRLWNFALDGIMSFSSLPLKAWLYIGALIAFTGFAYGVYIIVKTLILGIDEPGYASLMTAVLFFGGLQLLSLGVVGEYLSRVFIEVKGRPVYLVDQVVEPGVAGDAEKPSES